MILNSTSGDVLAQNEEWMVTASERSRGLLKYAEPPYNYGAVFKLAFGGFFPLIHTFGMKFPIDMVFCDENHRVVCIFRSVQPGQLRIPLRYFFGGCRYLVEFSRASTAGIKIGDILRWGSS